MPLHEYERIKILIAQKIKDMMNTENNSVKDEEEVVE